LFVPNDLHFRQEKYAQNELFFAQIMQKISMVQKSLIPVLSA
jgi:hypothetical protein